MKRQFALPVVLGTAALLALAGGAVTARNPDVSTGTTFWVYSADGSPDLGEQVVVTRQANWGKQAYVELCTKVSADVCEGQSYYLYQRAYAGAPWYRVDWPN